MRIDKDNLEKNMNLEVLDQQDKEKFVSYPKKSILATRMAAKLLHKLCNKCRAMVITDISLKGNNKFDLDKLCNRCKAKYENMVNK